MAATFLKSRVNIDIQLKYDGFISTGQKTLALQPFSCILWRGDQSCDKQISAPVLQTALSLKQTVVPLGVIHCFLNGQNSVSVTAGFAGMLFRIT